MAPPQNQRRRSAEDEDGPPQFAKKKTVKMHPAVGILLFASPVVMAIIVAVIYFNRGDGKAEQVQIEEPVGQQIPTWEKNYKKQLAAAKKQFREAMKHRASENQDTYKKEWNKANEAALDLRDLLDKHLDKHKDEDGVLKVDYSGYNDNYNEINQLLHDLLKTEPLGFDD